MDKTSEKERINEMLEAIMKVARGDYSVQIELSGKIDEIDSLAMGLNMMIDDIRNSIEELRRANEKLQASEEELRSANEELQASEEELLASNEELQTANEELRETQEQLVRLSEAVRMSADSIVISDVEGKIIYVNEATLKMYGTDDPKDLLEKSSFELIAPEDREKAFAGMKEVMERGYAKDREYQVISKGGNRLPVEMSTSFIKRKSGEAIGFVAISRDITERKRAEEALQQQNEFLNTVLESLTHPFYVVDANDYTIKIANSAAKAGDLSANPTCYALTHKRDKPCGHMERPCPLEKVKKTKKPVAVEHIHYDEDGNARNVEVHGYPVFDTEGNVIQMVEYCLDITERKRAEEELRSSEERLRILFEYAPDAYYLNDLKGNFIDGNKAAEEIIGYKRDELIGKSFLKLKLLSPRQIPKSAALLAKNVLGQATGPDEFILNRKDGTQIPVEIRTFPVKIEGKTLVLGIARDITERKQAEAKLRESDERYGAIFESTSDMLVLIDRKGKILDVNENIAQISEYKREEIVGKNIRSLTKIMTKKSLAIIAKNFLKRMAGMNIPPYEIQMIKKNGELRSVEINAVALRKDGRIVGDLAILKDITERKRMEKEIQDKNEQVEIQNEELQATEEELRASNEELRATSEELIDAQENLVRSERLAAIGQLAGGVGHELRNPLGAIKNAIYYVRGKVIKSELGNKEPRVMEFLDIIDEEINSSSKIIDDLLGFSRVSKPVVSPTRIEKVIEDALSYTTIPESIELTKKLGTDLPEVKIDTDQVRQALVNMIINAAQAMPTGGKLTISAGEKDKFLEVEITDTGCGIPQEVMGKIFDPLFTTRAKGIGLGLAVCKAIIDRHQGHIEVESKVGKETIFTIKLPLEVE